MNDIGAGSQSSIIGIHAASVPSAPNAPTLVSQSESAISFTWLALTPALHGGSPGTGYKLYWYDPTNLYNFVVLATTTTTNLAYTVSGLTAGLQYQFRIVATNIVGDSEMSVFAGFIASSLPGTPSTPILVAASNLPMI